VRAAGSCRRLSDVPLDQMANTLMTVTLNMILGCARCALYCLHSCHFFPTVLQQSYGRVPAEMLRFILLTAKRVGRDCSSINSKVHGRSLLRSN